MQRFGTLLDEWFEEIDHEQYRTKLHAEAEAQRLDRDAPQATGTNMKQFKI